MDFDEYEYLEKTVEDPDSLMDNDRKSRDGSDRSYRKRDGDRSIDGAEDDEDRNSKRSRGGDDDRSSRDRDRHRRDRDSEKDKPRDRERSHRDKDKNKEKEKERDRETEREKRRERDRELERERDRERERERRSRSSSRKGESDRELIRERERELELRESRRFKDKKEAVEPEADPERDQRTVFAYQMPLKATERDVYEFFSKAGKVRDVRLIMDRNSRRSKGVGNAIMMRDDGNTLHSCFINSCCVLKVVDMELFFPSIFPFFAFSTCFHTARYIEFYDVMSVPMAIALSGQLLLGQPVMVKPSEAEKNLVQSTTTAAGTGGLAGPYGAVDRKLYVGNLHFSITETQLREIFEAFGPVELVQLPLDIETGQCKGFGFVQFSHLEHAKAAQTLNGKLEIAGRVVKVSSVTDHVGAQDTGAKSADFDDDDGGGLSLNAQSRALLMQKLDRTGTATSIVGSLGVPARNGAAPIQQTLGLPINGQAALPLPVLPGQVLPTLISEPVGNPSECLLLKNMFDPETEEEPDFDMDIKDDVGEECSKYGHVKHIYVDKHSAGFVYVRFETVEAAMAAQRAMHMRWFARRLISALFMLPQDYEAKFGAGA